ncbi:MAG: methyltransferase family protein [Promethearchaeota archaeon]
MFALTIIFEILFTINFVLYWSIILKVQNLKIKNYYKKAFPIIWACCGVLILVPTSNIIQFIFNKNFSYFQDLWTWFLVLGVIFIIAGFKIISMVKKLYKKKTINIKGSKLVEKGIYSIIRHPLYLSWFLIFIGFSFIFDSTLTIIFLPIFIILLEIQTFLEEKFILIPIFGKKYQEYKKKTPFRLIPRPYIYIFVILAVIVVYIGFYNFVLKS